jgi:transcription elongation factor Elf1
MSCDICGRGACASWMHSFEDQQKYEKVIDLFEKARDLREETRLQDEETSNEDS